MHVPMNVKLLERLGRCKNITANDLEKWDVG
jgi:hypothetical protein